MGTAEASREPRWGLPKALETSLVSASAAPIRPSAWRDCLIIPEKLHCGLPSEGRRGPEKHRFGAIGATERGRSRVPQRFIRQSRSSTLAICERKA
jgi:hypothetical protein